MRKFTKYPTNYVSAAVRPEKVVFEDGTVYDPLQHSRYDAVMGFNTKQLWVYDNWEDVYIDPPKEVLDSLPPYSTYSGSEDAERELARIANEETPSWLQDISYWYNGEI